VRSGEPGCAGTWIHQSQPAVSVSADLQRCSDADLHTDEARLISAVSCLTDFQGSSQQLAGCDGSPRPSPGPPATVASSRLDPAALRRYSPYQFLAVVADFRQRAIFIVQSTRNWFAGCNTCPNYRYRWSSSHSDVFFYVGSFPLNWSSSRLILWAGGRLHRSWAWKLK